MLYKDYVKVKDFEEMAKEFGFDVVPSAGLLGLKPSGREYPHYIRSAEMAIGTVEELTYFLLGMNFARRYDASLNISSDEIRWEAEDKVRQHQMLETIKNA